MVMVGNSVKVKFALSFGIEMFIVAGNDSVCSNFGVSRLCS